MTRLEIVSYAVASVALAWSGGWLLIHGDDIAVLALCATWSLLTVCLIVRALRAGMRSPGERGTESGAG